MDQPLGWVGDKASGCWGAQVMQGTMAWLQMIEEVRTAVESLKDYVGCWQGGVFWVSSDDARGKTKQWMAVCGPEGPDLGSACGHSSSGRSAEEVGVRNGGVVHTAPFQAVASAHGPCL